MQPTLQNQGQEPVPTSAPEQVAPHTPATSTPRRSRRTIIVILLIAIVLIAAGLTVWLLAIRKDTSTSNSSTANQSSATVFTGVTSGIPNYVLRNSTTTQGVSTGYITRVDTISTTSPKVRLAAATKTKSYDPVVFYTGSSNGLQQVFMLTPSDKKSTQMTSGTVAATTPVFSSVSQLLAFQQGCQVHILTTKKADDIAASKSLPAADCYTPIAWSPDGTTLAFQGVTDNSFPDLGLVSKTTLYLYNTTNKKVDTITMPEGYMSLAGGQVKWVDDQRVIAHYVVWAKNAFVEKEAIFAVTTTTGKAVDTPIPASVSLPTIQRVNSKIYAYDQSTHAVMMIDSITDRTPDVVTETESWSSFLLQSDADTTNQAMLYGIRGSAGSEGSFSLVKVDARDKTEDIATLGGFSDYILGWGNNLNQIIYMSVKSGESEIRQYTLSTGDDIALQSHLPLIQ